MPVFYQHQINEHTRLGVWKIEETEEFFKGNVPVHRDVTHPHKRLQHLAGRFLLQFLFPDFPFELIQIADTRKPFLPDEQYHFSISHCGDYAAAIVSKHSRVGIDIEVPSGKIEKIVHKFLSDKEQNIFNIQSAIYTPQFTGTGTEFHSSGSRLLTLLWSAKESIFKWSGSGDVDFRKHIHLIAFRVCNEFKTLNARFSKNNTDLAIDYMEFENLILTWVVS